jgi:hypothetical protein
MDNLIDRSAPMKWFRVSMLVMTTSIAAAIVGACDDPTPQATVQTPPPPPTAPDNAATTSSLKIPTTQELVAGTRKVLALGPIPLTLRVPESWQIDVKGASLLTGHTPSSQGDKDKISIQLTSRPSMTQEAVDRMLDGAKKEQQAKPQSILKVEVRPLGGNVRVYERQAVGEPRPYTFYDAQNQPHTSTEQMFTWTISVLAPFEGAFQVYELNFVGLTKSLYDKDAEFLKGILNTLAYGSPPPSIPATAAPATGPAPAVP